MGKDVTDKDVAHMNSLAKEGGEGHPKSQTQREHMALRLKDGKKEGLKGHELYKQAMTSTTYNVGNKRLLGSVGAKSGRMGVIDAFKTTYSKSVDKNAAVATDRYMKAKGMKESMNELTNEILEAMDQEEFDALIEDYEQLDELSKDTLKSYIKGSARDQVYHGLEVDHEISKPEHARTKKSYEHVQSKYKKIDKREAGMNTAFSKLTKESMNEQTLELIDAIESGKSTAIETSFNEIMANKLVSAIDNRRQEIASGLFDMQEETVEEGVVPGSVKKDAKGNVLSFTTAPEDKRPDYQKKSFRELAMGANKAHVKMVAAKKRESGALPSDSANVRNLISQGR